jgi:hypothetical protein
MDAVSINRQVSQLCNVLRRSTNDSLGGFFAEGEVVVFVPRWRIVGLGKAWYHFSFFCIASIMIDFLLCVLPKWGSLLDAVACTHRVPWVGCPSRARSESIC